MLASPVHHQKHSPAIVSVFLPFMRRLNMGTVASILTIAFALLNITRGKEQIRALNDCSGSSHGSLEVSSVTNANDGVLLTHVQSSCWIYTADGKLLKSVENHFSRGNEAPEAVMLPAGSYIILARSQKKGYLRVPIVIKA